MAGSKAEGYMSCKFNELDVDKLRKLTKYLTLKTGRRVTQRQLFALLIEKYVEVEEIEVDADGNYV